MGIERRMFTWSKVVLLALAAQLTSGCITKGDTNIGTDKGKKTTMKPGEDEGDAGASNGSTTPANEETDEPSEHPEPGSTSSTKPQASSSNTNNGTTTSAPPASEDTEAPAEAPTEEPSPSASEEPATPSERLGFDRGPVRLSASASHTCGVTEAGALKCWGSPAAGKLGFDRGRNESVPQTVPGAADVLEVSAGGNHTCILLEGGTVHCWGSGGYGQLGIGDDDSLFSVGDPVVELEDVTHIDAGGRHTCALLKGGSVKCWGDNALGQLGADSATSKSNEPFTVPGLPDIVNLSAGESTTCAVDVNGRVWCWGDNSAYQIADVGGMLAKTEFPQELDLDNVEQVSVGSAHVCAVLHNKNVKCWGSASTAFGAADASGIFVQLDNVSGAVQVASGSDFACVLLESGGVRCVGDDTVGQLGNGSGTDAPFSSGVAQLTAGGVVGARYVCALLDTGSAKCWGDGTSGQLGNGAGSAASPAPVNSFKAAPIE